MRGLFLIFIIVPLIEMYILIKVGEQIGAWPTIGMVVLTAFIGINLLRQQGLSTLTRADQRMQQGEIPGQEMLEGLFLAVGGALLLTPGFMTDTFGFLCLIPPFRRGLIGRALKSGNLFMAGSWHTQSHSQPGQQSHHHEEVHVNERRVYEDEEGHSVIEGEYHRDDK